MKLITKILGKIWIYRFITRLFFGWKWKRSLYPEHDNYEGTIKNRQKK
jgi:hypothetical protein